MGATSMPISDVRVGDVVEWGPVREPVLDSFHSHASLNSMRTFPVCSVAGYPDRQGRLFLVFHTDERLLLEITHQAVLSESGRITMTRSPPSQVLRESHPAFYLDSGAEVNVHRSQVHHGVNGHSRQQYISN